MDVGYSTDLINGGFEQLTLQKKCEWWYFKHRNRSNKIIKAKMSIILIIITGLLAITTFSNLLIASNIVSTEINVILSFAPLMTKTTFLFPDPYTDCSTEIDD